ncbi:TPA: NADH-quinone oxidoreductase subunit C [Candidatus Avigastranaerophilus faecigallinarum]|nr:NADH-quinone oxidoreductase subunit C [Candidatus Avigastranaerophilus faecigallinarum]
MFKEFETKFDILNKTIILPNIQEFYIKKDNIKEALRYLKNSPETIFSRLDCIIAKDNSKNFTVSYILNSDTYNTKCAISYYLGYEEAETVSISDIYKNATWDEREIYDLFGIKFNNHPNLKRILLPDSFKGNPLRKDYIANDERLKWNNDKNF